MKGEFIGTSGPFSIYDGRDHFYLVTAAKLTRCEKKYIHSRFEPWPEDKLQRISDGHKVTPEEVEQVRLFVRSFYNLTS